MKKQIAQRYGWNDNQQSCSQAYLEPAVLSICDGLKPASVLDIGTGNGSLLPLWLRQGWRVSAMEPDAEGFEISQRVAGADVRQLGVGDDLPQEWREAFDVAISLEVVEHLFNPHHLVETAHAVLKPGGYAIISTPYHGYLKNLALALFDKWDFHHHPERVGGHIKFWSKRNLRSLFEGNKAFRAVDFRGAGRAPYLWNSMIWVFQKS
jgi:2-polyprenyl-3-methyl-5-hydroxy-6-metoxy-1,4-benzoquinol methylase